LLFVSPFSETIQLLNGIFLVLVAYPLFLLSVIAVVTASAAVALLLVFVAIFRPTGSLCALFAVSGDSCRLRVVFDPMSFARKEGLRHLPTPRTRLSHPRTPLPPPPAVDYRVLLSESLPQSSPPRPVSRFSDRPLMSPLGSREVLCESLSSQIGRLVDAANG